MELDITLSENWISRDKKSYFFSSLNKFYKTNLNTNTFNNKRLGVSNSIVSEYNDIYLQVFTPEKSWRNINTSTDLKKRIRKMLSAEQKWDQGDRNFCSTSHLNNSYKATLMKNFTFSSRERQKLLNLMSCLLGSIHSTHVRQHLRETSHTTVVNRTWDARADIAKGFWLRAEIEPANLKVARRRALP